MKRILITLIGMSTIVVSCRAGRRAVPVEGPARELRVTVLNAAQEQINSSNTHTLNCGDLTYTGSVDDASSDSVVVFKSANLRAKMICSMDVSNKAMVDAGRYAWAQTPGLFYTSSDFEIRESLEGALIASAEMVRQFDVVGDDSDPETRDSNPDTTPENPDATPGTQTDIRVDIGGEAQLCQNWIIENGQRICAD